MTHAADNKVLVIKPAKYILTEPLTHMIIVWLWHFCLLLFVFYHHYHVALLPDCFYYRYVPECCQKLKAFCWLNVKLWLWSAWIKNNCETGFNWDGKTVYNILIFFIKHLISLIYCGQLLHQQIWLQPLIRLILTTTHCQLSSICLSFVIWQSGISRVVVQCMIICGWVNMSNQELI